MILSAQTPCNLLHFSRVFKTVENKVMSLKDSNNEKVVICLGMVLIFYFFLFFIYLLIYLFIYLFMKYIKLQHTKENITKRNTNKQYPRKA